ncbi:MAG: dockerin type I domain-containing protein [candidate division Zixibacteria bacterium]|nr:dockerin type I domain-containing protein [candidate division Zixibacteria bacterium]
MSEDFEDFTPGFYWEIIDNNGIQNGEYYWGVDSYKPHWGDFSIWCARNGYDGLDPEYNEYPDSCESWMVYGPFSLTDAEDAELLFYWWLRSEVNCDTFFWGASYDNDWFYGNYAFGSYLGFWYQNFDLTDVYEIGDLCGYPLVWIAFVFTSNATNTDSGVYIDDITLHKSVPTPDLIVERITPSNSNPNIGNNIYVDVIIKNQGSVGASGFYTGLYYNPAQPPDISTSENQKKWVGYLDAYDDTLITFTNITSTEPITWHIYSMADCDGNVDETSENNNVEGPTTVNWWDPSTFPDLVIDKVTVSTYCPYVTDSVFVNVRIKNQGDSRVYYPFGFYTSIFYDTTDAPIAPLDGDDWHHSPYPLYPDESESFSFILPAPFDLDYHWSMWLLVDSDNIITETNEYNNVFGPLEFSWWDEPTYKMPLIGRDQIIENAMEFTLIEWICPVVNAITPYDTCDFWSSNYIVGQTYWGEPYEYGGCDDTGQFRCNLDKGLRAGALGISEFCPLPPGGYAWATGIECAALVWRTYNAGWHSTKNLDEIGNWIFGWVEYLLKGDYLLTYDKHTFIFESWGKNNLMNVIEAANFLDIDDDNSSEARYLTRSDTFYTQYNAYQYKNVQEVTGYDPDRAGDANSDGQVSVSDQTFLINYIFKGSNIRPHPMWRGDANGDCNVSISDIVYIISYLFKGGAPPKYCTDCESRTCYYYP